MDDIFQILIILVFIISSIYSSIKKKKKREQQSKLQQQQPETVQPNKASQKQKSSSEIMEEILGFKVQIPEPLTTEAPNNYSESDIEHKSWDPAEGFGETKKEKKLDYIEKDRLKKESFLKEKQKHKAFKDTEVVIKKKLRKTKFQNLFNGKSSLKDSIIVQELLNKPKALRR